MAARYVPACCTSNQCFGFVVAIKTHEDDGVIYGDEWEATLVDAFGDTSIVKVDNCPLCGCHLDGMDHIILREKDNEVPDLLTVKDT